MSNRKLIAILIALVALMTLILAPVGLLTNALAGSTVVGVAKTSGTMWAGRLDGVTLAGSPMGDLKVGLSPVALMSGQIRVGVRRDPVAAGRAAILLGGRAHGVEGLSLRAPIDLAQTGLPLAGVVAVTDASGVFRQHRCVRASGQIQIRLTGEGPLRGAVLSGEPRCQGGSWVAALVGNTANGKATLIARIDGSGRSQLEMAIATSDEAMIQSLLAHGFSRDATGARRIVEGRLVSSGKAVAKQGVKRAP